MFSRLDTVIMRVRNLPAARAAHAHLLARGVEVGPVTEGPGVRYVRFADPDGNPLEACEVLAPAA